MGRKMMIGALVLGCLGWVGAEVYYVDDSATGANDGSSWADAFTDLQMALDAAIKGDEVRVAQGTYRPTVPGGDRGISFVVPDGVTLLGGYAGVEAPDPDQRNIEVNRTILSGDLNGDDVLPADVGHLSDAPSRQDNSYHVVRFPYVFPATENSIGGFTITGGNANGGHYTQHSGGGVEVNGSKSVIEDCVIADNSASYQGGGCESGELRNCQILNNFSNYGGGVSFPRAMESCILQGNVAQYGGGMNGANGESAYIRCQFIANEASQGGAVFLGNHVGVFEQCDFTGNLSKAEGGAAHIMNDCTCLSELTLIRCRLVNNISGSRGGAIYHEGNSRVVLYSCLLDRNHAADNGGGIYSLTYKGMREMGYLGVTNCTIVGNDAGQTGGLWFCSATTEFLDVVNTILWGNQDLSGTGQQEGQIRISTGCGQSGTGGDAIVPGIGTPIPVRYCCIEGLTDGFGGPGNNGADPLFIPSGGPLPNYHLTAESPCINAGTNTAYPCFGNPTDPGTGTWVDPSDPSCPAGLKDLDVMPRIRGGNVDMGAYEFQTMIGTLLYVDDSATGFNDGSCWGDAFQKLQDALAIVVPGQEIQVAQGLYLPADPNGNREATFQLKNGVKIRGGYAGFGTEDPDARDVSRYRSILSGDLGQSLPTLNAETFYDKLVVRARDEYTNSFHVVSAVGVDATAVLDGFVITGGTANGFVYGESADPKYYHGGGVYIESASPTLIDCTITGNIAFVYNGPAAMGGGLYNEGGNPSLIRCSLIQNVADDYDSDAFGAGMFNETGRPILIGCRFDHNQTFNWGGGIANRGHSHPILRDCVFTDNFGQYGGGGLWDAGTGGGDIDGCVFSRNITHIDGGAISLGYGNSSWKISHSLVFGNKAEWAAGIQISTTDVQVINCTVANNRARDQWGGVMCENGSAQFVDCIFWGNTCDNDRVEWAQIGRDDGVSRFDYCCVQGWTGEFSGVGTIDVDPLFANPAGGDYRLKSQAGRWDAASGGWIQDGLTSPCIDAGHPAIPIMYEPFPNGGMVNMGFDGGTALASKSWFGGPMCEVIAAGDINGDCTVDLADFALLAGHWLENKGGL